MAIAVAEERTDFRENRFRTYDQTSDPTGAYVYGYDAANRLTSATYPAAYGFTGNQAYVYDQAGNREDPVNASLYAYDANNRLTASPRILPTRSTTTAT